MTKPGLSFFFSTSSASVTETIRIFIDVPRSSMNEAGTVVYQPIATAWRLRIASAFSVIEP